MELFEFFTPIELPKENYHNDQLGAVIDKYTRNEGFPDLSNVRVVLFGVEESRNSANNNFGAKHGPNKIREQLYKLYNHSFVQIADLGNIQQGETVNDTYFALSNVVRECVKNGVVCFILGGTSDLTYANYLGYKDLEQSVNMVAFDKELDFGNFDDPINSSNFTSKIILSKPNFLFNYSNIGYQSYFTSESHIQLLGKMYFDLVRLGEIRANIREVEPIVRNADFISFDLSAIRNSDAPATAGTTPNGFAGEEACQITRYAGLSDKVSSFGLYEYNPELDTNGTTALLIAQMAWYFIDGVSARRDDVPSRKSKDYLKYRVSMPNQDDDIIFYKSLKSDRWWMDVPAPSKVNSIFFRHQLVPCSYTDYQSACNEDVPDRWWKAYQKLAIL